MEEKKFHEINQRLQELDDLKDNFVALVSHELRTPVNLIAGYLDLGIAELGDDQQRAKEYLELAEKNTRRIIRIVQELTDFARLQRGKEITHLHPLPIRDVIVQVKQLLRPDLEKKQLNLKIDLPEQIRQAAYDGESMIIILRNVLSNAAKFSPPQQNIKVKGEIKDDHLVVECIDWADPIPASKQDIIFEDFRQVENYLTRRYEGMGLGLAVARRTARFLGGDIQLEVRNDGNTFLVILPRA